jgi:Mn2+/Fe2+ NRAMP family transporter
MKPIHLLIAIVIAVATTGAIEGYMEAHRLPEPFWYTIGSTFLICLLIFVWYHFDSEARAYRRSRWMNMSVVAVAVVAIPVYLVKSREQGFKLQALIRMTAFGALCVFADFLGGRAGGLFI